MCEGDLVQHLLSCGEKDVMSIHELLLDRDGDTSACAAAADKLRGEREKDREKVIHNLCVLKYMTYTGDASAVLASSCEEGCHTCLEASLVHLKYRQRETIRKCV